MNVVAQVSPWPAASAHGACASRFVLISAAIASAALASCLTSSGSTRCASFSV